MQRSSAELLAQAIVDAAVSEMDVRNDSNSEDWGNGARNSMKALVQLLQDCVP